MREGQVLARLAFLLAAESEEQLRERMTLALAALQARQGCFRLRVDRPPLEPVHHTLRSPPSGCEACRGTALPPPEAPLVHRAAEREAPAWLPAAFPGPPSPPLSPASLVPRIAGGPWLASHQGPGASSVLCVRSEFEPEPGSDEERCMADALRLLAGVLHGGVMRLVVPRLLARLAPRLTVRESTCLHWVAQGKSDGVVATILGVSDSAVHFHMTNVLRKLGVSTRTQAVAKAMALGLIP